MDFVNILMVELSKMYGDILFDFVFNVVVGQHDVDFMLSIGPDDGFYGIYLYHSCEEVSCKFGTRE